MIGRVLLCLVLVLSANLARADTVCLDFTATPATYTAPAGGTFTVVTTYTNCGDTTISIGGGFGSDESVYVSQFFYDPAFDLAVGDSVTTAFADYTWDPNAPPGFVWNPNINVAVGEGFVFTSFTATVEQPVPEPATLLLLSTGIAGIALKARRRIRPRR